MNIMIVTKRKMMMRRQKEGQRVARVKKMARGI